MSTLRRPANLVLVTTVLCLALAASVTSALAQRITFLLVNDIYLMDGQRGEDGKVRGGFARLAAVVKAERAKGHPVIFAHGGDTLSPSIMSGLDRGEHIVALTNTIHPDIFAPGNHEFDFGKDVFLQRMREARFPIFAANLRDPDGNPIPGFKDREIVAFGGVRIGLTGATYDDAARTSNPQDLRIAPTVQTLKDNADALRRDGADFVVAVAHATRAQAQELLGTRKADLILTGHTHDLLISFDGRNALVESSYDAHYVTAIDIDFDVNEIDGRRQVRWWPNFRIIDTATVTPDPDVSDAVKGYEQELSHEMDVSLAMTAVELDARSATVRTREAAIGNLFADAMREQTGADAAIMNGGGIRSGKVYPPGSSITRRDVLAELPFGNRTVVVDVTGRDLRAALENGLSQLPRSGGRFPQVSGIAIEVDPARPPGARIVSMKIGGLPLEEARTYKVAINDFMARGGDGYVQFRDAPRSLAAEDSPLLANQVMVYLRQLGTVHVATGNRIVVR